MEVILLEKIRNLGDLGEKVNVKSGFSRNYLIPQGKAVTATGENLALFEKRRSELEKKAGEELSAAQARADKLNKLQLKIEALASDEGKLYGSVGPNEIAQAINDAGVEVFKREISLPEGPIHSIGEYEITAQLHSDVMAKVKIEVTPGK